MHMTEAKGILSGSGNALGMNIYRGCTHGCIYCDSRSACYQMNHPFEDVEVKRNAPELLEKALRSRRKKGMIATGSMSDPYMPAEAQLQLTRRCLKIIRAYGFGAAVLTKSDLILRDLDLLRDISRNTKCVVQMTLTAADDALSRRIEPNVCTSARRIQVLEIMRSEGIPTIVWLSPVLPFISDTEENLKEILDGCIHAGVKGIICFGMGMTLREGNREYYYEMLDRKFPGLRAVYESTYGTAYEVMSPRSAELMRLFHDTCSAHHILHTPESCFAWMREFPNPYEQLSLF